MRSGFFAAALMACALPSLLLAGGCRLRGGPPPPSAALSLPSLRAVSTKDWASYTVLSPSEVIAFIKTAKGAGVKTAVVVDLTTGRRRPLPAFDAAWPVEGDGMPKSLSWAGVSPDGKWLAFSSCIPLGNAPPDNFKFVPLGTPSTIGVDVSPRGYGTLWLRDGRLLSFDQFGVLLTVSTAGLTRHDFTPGGDLRGLATPVQSRWLGAAAAGRVVIASLREVKTPTVECIEADAKSMNRILRRWSVPRPPGTILAGMSMSPDGKRWLWSLGTGEKLEWNELWVSALDGGGARKLVRLKSAPPEAPDEIDPWSTGAAWTPDGRRVLYLAEGELRSIEVP